MILIDGKKIQLERIEKMKKGVSKLKSIPKLVIIQVGNDGPSNKYVSQKLKVGTEIGIEVLHLHYQEVSEKELINKIQELNIDNSVNGIMVQLPLPKELDEDKIINSISALKDVDGLTTENIGKLFDKGNCFIPCTALGVMNLFKEYNIDLAGKHVVLVGRSKLVGKPLISCLLNENATVTVTHSKTSNLKDITKEADILIVAIGKAHYITNDMVKDNSVVIDVGTNLIDGHLTGDVDFENVKDKVSYITPVPNGVGRMTVISLMENVIKAYNEQNSN